MDEIRINSLLGDIKDILMGYGLNRVKAGYLSMAILIGIIVILCIIINIITKNIILRILGKIIHRDKHLWYKVMLERNVFSRIANLLPGIVVYLFAPAFGKEAVGYIHRACAIFIAVISVFVISALLNAIDDVYRNYPISKARPIKGFLQICKIIFYIIVVVIIIGILMDQNPLVLLSGIGALAAVFSFVFKDSILGFIAGIQLTSNDMLRIGDWIEMNKYGADGDVVDITLNTVKVQNFDKTIVTIPAYSLVSDSFRNWRGMTEFGGRRIKRSVIIDVSSIQFCTPEMLEKYKKIHYLKSYIEEKEEELQKYNKKFGEEDELNIKQYLRDNPRLHSGTQMVRQLPQEANGLPLEIYVFTDDIKWENYERIQSDIFDHIFAVAKEFDLRIFQSPTGYDMQKSRI